MAQPRQPLPLEAWLDKAVTDLLACVCTEVAERGVGPVCWCGLQSGEATWDGCGECDGGHCGMAYARVIRAFPYTAFPENEGVTTCDTAIGFDLEVGVMRCFPTHEDGTGLEPEEALAVALDVNADLAALHRAIACCLEVPVRLLGEWVPLGPQGGCVGGAWTLSIGMV